MTETVYSIDDAHAANGTTPDRDSWTPTNLNTLPEHPPIQPTLGNVGIVYPGKRHVFSGAPESAKTLAGYAILIQVVRAPAQAILIDFEMGGYDARARLRELGATSQEIDRIHYLEPDQPATQPRIHALIQLDPSLVLIDAAAGAYDIQGLDDNQRKDVEKWSSIYVRSFWRAGIATILIDHVVKNAENRGRFQIGSERKLGGADVHLGFETITPISRGTTGLYKIVTHKDRGGYLQRGALANLELVSHPETHQISWTFKAAEHIPEDAPFRPTTLMERVSTWLRLQTEPVARNKVEEGVKGKSNQAKKTAIDVLIREGFVAETEGARGAKLVQHVRVYKHDDPDCNPETEAGMQTKIAIFATSPDLPRPPRGTSLLTSPSSPPLTGERGGQAAHPGDATSPEIADRSWLDELAPDPDDDDPETQRLIDTYVKPDDDIPF